MTWGEVKNQARDLNFDKPAAIQKSAQLYVEAANRVQTDIARDIRPIYGRLTLSHRPLPSLLGEEAGKPVLYSGKPLRFNAENAKAYTFSCDGTGTLTITDRDGEREIPLCGGTGFTRYRGFLNGDASLVFSGEYAYSIRELGVYGSRYSDREWDIPAYSDYLSYDIRELTREKDADGNPGRVTFMDFLPERPVSRVGEGNPPEYRREAGRILLLPRSVSGEFEVWYKKLPAPLTLATPDDYPLELDELGAQLMPMLMAFYIGIDDDKSRAVLYRNDFYEKAASVMAGGAFESSPPDYRNSSGWW